jgi:hypothetical protein
MLHPSALEAYRKLVKLSAVVGATIAHELPGVDKAIQDTRATPLENLADLVYVLRESEKLLDSLRKEVSRRYEEAQHAACVAFTQAPPEEFKVDAEYVTGMPDPKKAIPNIKREGNEEVYDRFLREVLKVQDESVIASGSIVIHYVHFREWLTNQLRSGVNIPEELLPKSYTEYNFKVTKRREKSLLPESTVDLAKYPGRV